MNKLGHALILSIVSAALLTTADPTHAIVIRHDVEAAMYRALPKDYPAVVSFLWEAEEGVGDTTSLSGTLLDRHWVLTAAHGADEFDQKRLRIEVGGVIYEGVSFDAWHPHPCFDADESPMDVGLVYFANPPWPELETYPTLYRNQGELDKVIVFVGKGAPGNGLTGSLGDEPGGSLRSATNTVEVMDEALLGFTFHNPLERMVTMREGISGPGDSGGPALMCEMLMLDVNGRLACTGAQSIVGVSSHQLSDDEPYREGVYGVTERYARVSTHAAWIDATMATGHAGTCEATGWQAPTEETRLAADGPASGGGGCNGGPGPHTSLWGLLVGLLLMGRLRELLARPRRPTCQP